MPSTTGKMQQRQPRMPSWISSPVARLNIDVTSSNAPPQYGHRRRSSVETFMVMSRPAAKAPSSRPGTQGSELEHTALRAADRRAAKMLDAEPAPRLRVLDVHEGMSGAHLAPMASNGRELSRHPGFDVDHDGRRGGAIAERVRRQAPEPARRRRPTARGRPHRRRRASHPAAS